MTQKLSITDSFKLPSGRSIPALGLGVFMNDDPADAIDAAFEAGYRHIDTAIYYQNEDKVGEAVRSSSLPRDEIFVTSKVMSHSHGYNKTIQAFNKSLARLGLEYVDLFLIHDPLSGSKKRLETWKALLKLRDDGKIKDVGVSNYGVRHLEEIKAAGLEKPPVNQIELHPWCQQRELVKYCQDNSILVEAYCPLTQGRYIRQPILLELAKKYKKDAGQILIRWSLQKGFICLPKSSRPARVKSNADVYDFSLSDDDMTRLDELDMGARGAVSWHPVNAP